MASTVSTQAGGQEASSQRKEEEVVNIVTERSLSEKTPRQNPVIPSGNASLSCVSIPDILQEVSEEAHYKVSRQ